MLYGDVLLATAWYKGMLDHDLQNDDSTVRLLKLAHTYQVESLVHVCIKALQVNFAEKFACERLILAEELSLQAYRRFCIAWIRKYTTPCNVLHLPGLGAMLQKHPQILDDVACVRAFDESSIARPSKAPRTK